MKEGELDKIGYRCRGSKPWLGIEDSEECSSSASSLKVVLRGATNVWFADARSSIRIPTMNSAENSVIAGIVRDNFESINSSRVNGEINHVVTDFLAMQNHVDKERLYQAFVDAANQRWCH